MQVIYWISGCAGLTKDIDRTYLGYAGLTRNIDRTYVGYAGLTRDLDRIYGICRTYKGPRYDMWDMQDLHGT